MRLSLFNESESHIVIDLFRRAFSASEGEAEGQVIAKFVSNLISSTSSEDLIGWVAKSNDVIVGSVFFSRLTVPNGEEAFILSPLAVETDAQGTGIGKKLILRGLDHLRSLNVRFVITYGDPNYYAKTGFEQISENTVHPPFKLSYPNGWLAQSLTDGEIDAMDGTTKCVAALNDPSLW